MAEGTVTSTDGTLIEHNCAIPAVAERFPEICAAEAKFLAAVLGAEVQRQGHILSGCSACEYRVHFNLPSSAAAGATDGPTVDTVPSAPPSQEKA
jgi:predicted ArsR family transcriptional regulator